MLGLALGGFAARLMSWRTVFTPAGVELLPADSHYSLRRSATTALPNRSSLASQAAALSTRLS